jgi:hypothetical protein
MSAAAALPRVWAMQGPEPRRAEPRPECLRPAPLSGAAFYRKYTESLMRKYLRVSMDMGRLPSVLSKGVFRGRASSYRIRNFEDAVVFVIDVERCLNRLDRCSQDLVVRITLQEYTQAETAELTGQSLRSVIRKYGEVLDRLTAIFLEAELFDKGFFASCQDAGHE